MEKSKRGEQEGQREGYKNDRWLQRRILSTGLSNGECFKEMEEISGGKQKLVETYILE